MVSGLARALLPLVLLGCSSSTERAPDSGTAPERDAGRDASGMDARVDAGLEACGDAHIAYRFHIGTEVEMEGCLPLAGGAIGTVHDASSCVFNDMQGFARGMIPSDGGLTITVAMGGRPYLALGPVADWASIRLYAGAPPVCTEPVTDGYCEYNANGEPGCDFEMTAIGWFGDTIEARLRSPCALQRNGVMESPVRTPIFDALVMRGPLTASFSPDAAVDHCPDAGL